MINLYKITLKDMLGGIRPLGISISKPSGGAPAPREDNPLWLNDGSELLLNDDSVLLLNR